jgi:hypothetical protein
MNDRPTPLSPPECDLRDYTWMPLDVVSLLDSDLFALSTGEEFKAAVALWCKAWSQLPGGSLPSDERVLAHLSTAGSRWAKVRDMALRGWVQCSDGRLYHPIVSKKASEAWTLKLAQKARTEAARNAKKQKSHNRDSTQKSSVIGSVTGSVTEDDTEAITGTVTEPVTEFATCPVAQIVTGSNRPYQTRPSSLRSDSASLRSAGAADATPAGGSENDPKTTDRGLFDGYSPPDDQKPPDIPDPKQALFHEGVSIFRDLTGQSDASTRSQIGTLRRDSGDDCGVVLSALRQAAKLRPADPMAWLKAAVRSRKQTRPVRHVASPWKDGSDDHGIYGWISTLSDVADEPDTSGDPRFRRWRWTLGGYYLDAMAANVADIIRLPPGWKGDWSALASWLRDGIQPEVIEAAIRRVAERRNVSEIRSMLFFDGAVREQRKVMAS